MKKVEIKIKKQEKYENFERQLEKSLGGGFRMGNTCIPVADSC